ncbi:MAG: HAMP domain-containing sensor histidine kinase [Solirubrobacterales bacterium]
MKRLERILARLTPKRWPVRWRLAAVSAALTLVILVIFAGVVGRLTSNRLQNDFNDDVRGTASTIAAQTRVNFTLGGGVSIPSLEQRSMAALPPNSAYEIVHENGQPIAATAKGLPSLGRPDLAGVHRVGDLAIASSRVPGTFPVTEPLFIQYARNTASLESTISKLWLFLGLGVLGGTVLATLAGIAIAGRAMRPIAALTATARKIATTRDPSQRMPVPDNDDEVRELAVTLEQMLRQLDAARSEAEQMMQAQREFVADASHELRTPLTSILANLELLQEGLDELERGGEEGEMVASALRSSRRMSRLVSDLLLLARADAGRASSRRECDLSEVAAAAVSEVRPVANGRHLTIDEDGPVPVEGNPDELHRLALNLLDNGLRHTPEGTEIRVSVERRNGDAVLEVSDDGPGLPAGMEDQVFSRFVRGNGPADLAPETGTGLGLAIVKAVATSHGGEVDAGASASGGARFTVRLPAAT